MFSINHKRTEKTWCLFKISGNALLKHSRPTAPTIYNIYEPIGLKLISRLRLGSSHLKKNKFKLNFQDCLNPLRAFSLETWRLFPELFLQCRFFTNISPALLRELQLVDPNIEKSGDNEMVWLLLYDSPKLNSNQNLKTLSSCISFILKSERLDDSLSQRQLEVVDNKMLELHTYSVWQSCKYW